MDSNRLAISPAKLRKLERTLYNAAIDGDYRLGLYLLRLYYKDLRLYHIDDDQTGNSALQIILPQMIDDETAYEIHQ